MSDFSSDDYEHEMVLSHGRAVYVSRELGYGTRWRYHLVIGGETHYGGHWPSHSVVRSLNEAADMLADHYFGRGNES